MKVALVIFSRLGNLCMAADGRRRDERPRLCRHDTRRHLFPGNRLWPNGASIFQQPHGYDEPPDLGA
jgi:hypothetical protein